MLSLQNVKAVSVIAPASFSNGATECTGYVDTIGFSEIDFVVSLSGVNSATNNPSTFQIEDATASNGTYTAITVTVGDTAWTVPNMGTDTSVAGLYMFHGSLLGQYERYLKLNIVPVTTQVISAVALLSRPVEMPNTSTKQNLAVARVDF